MKITQIGKCHVNGSANANADPDADADANGIRNNYQLITARNK